MPGYGLISFSGLLLEGLDCFIQHSAAGLRSLAAAGRSPEWEQHLPRLPRSIFLSTHPHEHLSSLIPAFPLLLQCVTSDTHKGLSCHSLCNFSWLQHGCCPPEPCGRDLLTSSDLQRPLGVKAGGKASPCPGVLCRAFQKSRAGANAFHLFCILPAWVMKCSKGFQKHFEHDDVKLSGVPVGNSGH